MDLRLSLCHPHIRSACCRPDGSPKGIKVPASRLIEESCANQDVLSDCGFSMKPKPVVLLSADLGITKHHSRPSLSNDNSSFESQIESMKYQPEFPNRNVSFSLTSSARMH